MKIQSSKDKEKNPLSVPKSYQREKTDGQLKNDNQADISFLTGNSVPPSKPSFGNKGKNRVSQMHKIQTAWLFTDPHERMSEEYTLARKKMNSMNKESKKQL